MASPASLLHPKPLLVHPQQQQQNYDPRPDWSLEDLQQELDAISSKLNASSPTLPKDRSPTPPSATCSFSWRKLSVAADFGRSRRPFQISAFDSDSDSDSCTDSECVQGQTDVQQNVIRFDNNSIHTKEVEKSSPLEERDASVDEGPRLLPRTEITEGLMFELERERLQRVQEEIRQRRFQLEIAIEEETMRQEEEMQ